MKKRPRRKLTGAETARALAGGVHDPGDELWARLVEETDEEEREERLIRRLARRYGVRSFPDPD